MTMKTYITAKEIAEIINGRVVGNPEKRVYNLALLKDSNDKSLTFIPKLKFNRADADNADFAVMIRTPSLLLPKDKTYIFTNDDFYNYADKIMELFIERKLYNFNYDSAPQFGDCVEIGKSSFVGNNSIIGHNSIIGNNVSIGNNVLIGEHCHIYDNVVINDNVIIKNNVNIYAGAVIGGKSFEYAIRNLNFFDIPNFGKVIINDYVDIGANTTIDNGTIGNTIIGANTKIDNLVQIGHEVIIGNNCVICAMSGLAGWSELGNNCVLMGQVGVANYVKIGSYSVVKAKSLVAKSFDNRMTISGIPARLNKEELKFNAFLRNMFKRKG